MDDRQTHVGHREKVRLRLTRAGADAFLPHELLELLLFYAIPYRDTNPTAHRLLDRFGTLSGVLQAPADELTSVSGIGEHAAALIAAVREIGNAALLGERRMEKPETVGSLARRAQALFAGADSDRTIAFFLDNACRLIGEETVFTGYLGAVGFREKYIVGPALERRASAVVLASYHAARSAHADEGEIAASDRFRQKLGLAGLSLYEHFLISSDRVNRLSVFYPASVRESRRTNPFFHDDSEGGGSDD